VQSTATLQAQMPMQSFFFGSCVHVQMQLAKRDTTPHVPPSVPLVM